MRELLREDAATGSDVQEQRTLLDKMKKKRGDDFSGANRVPFSET